jgi:hypothetical protein
MTSHWRTALRCDCGHEGQLHMSENDQPFTTQWERWHVSEFDSEEFYLERSSTTKTKALARMNPKCPACGERGKIQITGPNNWGAL